jgi:hypothetical protein
MTDRTFRERREKVEFREQLREFCEHTIDRGDDIADRIENQYWQDVRDGMFDDDPIDDERWESDLDDYEDWYDDGLDDLDDYDLWYDDQCDDRGRSIFEVDDEWKGIEKDGRLASPGNHIRNGDGRVWLVLTDGRWADILTGEVKRPSRSRVPSEWIVFE